jgi:hypothetical protein
MGMPEPEVCRAFVPLWRFCVGWQPRILQQESASIEGAIIAGRQIHLTLAGFRNLSRVEVLVLQMILWRERYLLSQMALGFRQLEDQGVFEASKMLSMGFEHPIRLQEPLMEVPQTGGRFVKHPHLHGHLIFVG